MLGKIFTEDNDKWASTLLTTQASKAAPSSCRFRVTGFESLASLSTIVVHGVVFRVSSPRFWFRLSLIGACQSTCQSNNWSTVNSNHSVLTCEICCNWSSEAVFYCKGLHLFISSRCLGTQNILFVWPFLYFGLAFRPKFKKSRAVILCFFCLFEKLQKVGAALSIAHHNVKSACQGWW